MNRPAIVPTVIYRDPRTAMAWLEKAFGFEVSEVLTNGEDQILHAQMSFGDGVIVIGRPWVSWTCSPASAGALNTQLLNIRLDQDVDAHCERARAAGAVIVQEPEDQFYGDRSYMAQDLDGHHWSFGQAQREISWEELRRMAKAGEIP